MLYLVGEPPPLWRRLIAACSFRLSSLPAMKVTIDLPDRDDLGVDERYAKEALVATLYSTGKLSGREAREVLGMTRRAFEEMLPRYGFSILVDSPENVETELNA